MPSWTTEQLSEKIRDLTNEDFHCYMEFGCGIRRFNKFISKEYRKDEQTDCYEKTYALRSGVCDGEDMDLFELQEWFDRNREWINNLKETVEENI